MPVKIYLGIARCGELVGHKLWSVGTFADPPDFEDSYPGRRGLRYPFELVATSSVENI